MKLLHSFTVNQTVEVDEQETKQENGQSVTVTRKVKKEVPCPFHIVRPNRELNDEARLFYGVKLGEGIKRGLLTNAQLAKRFANDGGVFSDGAKQEYQTIYSELQAKQTRFRELASKEEKERTKEEQEAYTKMLTELVDLNQRIKEFEDAHASLFEETAESHARNKIIVWWVLHLSHKENDKKEPVPFFGVGSFEDRLKRYDDYDEKEDEFAAAVIKKFSFLVGAWFMGRAFSKDEFAELEKIYDASG
jgi:hypothetical protein